MPYDKGCYPFSMYIRFEGRDLKCLGAVHSRRRTASGMGVKNQTIVNIVYRIQYIV